MSGDVNIRGGADGHSFSCKGQINEGTTNSGRMGLYIRHDNDSQGISIGYAGIIANGTNPTQTLYIRSKSTFTDFAVTGTSPNQTYTLKLVDMVAKLAP